MIGHRYFLSAMLILTLLGGVYIVAGGNRIKNHPIRYVKVEGAFQYISKEGLKQVLKPYIDKGYYQADMAEIHQALKAIALVEKADVKRVWPDAVHIKITEFKPVVRWGDKAVLTKQGDLLYPDDMVVFQNLPLITGPEGQEKKWLEIMKGVYLELKDKSLQLAEFHVNERQAWRIKLTSGLEMQLGGKAPLENLHRFLKTIDLLGVEQIPLMESVDTRYPNGYAVTWKTDMATTALQAIMEKIKN